MLKTVTNIINASQIQTPITFAGDVTLSTGNLVIGTAGKGIDFSATSHPAGMTSELLADYEEGTWTPIIGGNATYLQQIGNYVKVGKLVTVNFLLQINVRGTGSAAGVLGLPYATANIGTRSAGSLGFYQTLAINVIAIAPFITQTGGTTFLFSTSAAASNASTDVAAIIGNGAFIMGSLTYQTA